MSLPVPIDVPLAPVMVIDRSRIPFIPQITDPNFQHVLPDIAVRIVNQSGLMSSRNAIRMFCYNLISQNMWMNPFYEEVFRLIIDHLRLTTKNGTSVPLQTLVDQSTDTILSLYSSSLVFVYNELQSVISPQQLEASSQNAGLLHNLKTEMNSMSFQGQPYPQYPAPYPAPQPQGYPQMVPQGYTAPMPGYMSIQQPGYTAIHPGQAPYYPGGQVHQPNNGFIQSAVIGHYPQNGMGRAPVDYAPRPDPTLTRDYGKGQQPRPVHQHTPYHPVPDVDDRYHRHQEPKTVPMYENKSDIVNQGRYFNQPVDAYEPEDVLKDHRPYESSTRDLTGDVDVRREQHEIVNTSGIIPYEEQQAINAIKESDKIDVEVLSSLNIDINLEIPISQFRANLLASNKDQFVRQYIYVYSVLLSHVNVDDKLNQWIHGDTLTAVAIHLQSLISLLSGSEVNEVEAKATLLLLRDFDQKITDKINRFIQEELESSFSIQSFIEDYQELPRYVLQTLGKEGSDRLKLFDTSLIKAFRNNRTHDELKEAAFINLSKNVNIGYIPNTYTLTFIPLDRTALNLPYSYKKIILEPHQDKLLYELAKNLFSEEAQENNPFADITVETHILITKDDVRYRVARSIHQPNEFYLKKI